MKRGSPGQYTTYDTAIKRQRRASGGGKKRVKITGGGPQRAGYGSVARTRGAAVTGEMKYFDTENAATAVAAVTNTWVAGTLVDPLTTINLGSAAVANPLCLFAPTVGAALNQRIGRKVKMLKVKITGMIYANPQAAQTAADPATKIRLLVVMDQQTNAGPMTSAMLLNDASAANATINSFQNPNNFGRFRVLKDKSWIMQNPGMEQNGVTTFEQNGLKIPFKCNINFKTPVDVHFNATNGGTCADIIDNSLHIICGSDSALLVSALAYYTRVCYKE